MSNINPTRKIMQRIAWFFIILMINQIAFPAAALALTAGAAQPEYKTFVPAGTTDMVNLFSGDFNYNIPLLEVPGSNGGYPINLFYNSVLSPDEEASWTGLGWNINVGALSRSMRGIPDDFDGEPISRKLDMRPTETTTIGVTGAAELAGYDPSQAITQGSGLSTTINYVYNSYQGAGISIDPMAKIGLNTGVSFGNGLAAYSPNFNLGMSISTLDAAKVNIGIGGASALYGKVSGSFGIHINARSGLDYSLRVGININDGISRSGTVSFAKNTYVPEVTMPWTGESFLWNANFMAGGAYVYGKFGLKGSFSSIRIKNGGVWKDRPSYGINYLQNSNEHSILDFNREKDQVLHRFNRYLANPILTHDVYNISGQGIGGSFRAHRSDYGVLHEPTLYSDTHGASIGAEGGIAFELGVNGSGIYRFEENKQWPLIGAADYKATASSTFEPFYYKLTSDISAEENSIANYVGKNTARNKPLRLKREGFDFNKSKVAELMGEKHVNGTPISGTYDTKLSLDTDQNYRDERKKRNVSVQPITNSTLRNADGTEALIEYDVKYYSKNNLNDYAPPPSMDIDRPNNKQNAGFTVLGQSGVRWVYGLPVYNHEQKEAKFSVAAPSNPCSKRVAVDMENNDRNAIDYIASQEGVLRSNDYIDEQKIPSYVHTHLLTTVLGSDYGDVDDIPGPSDKDVGYWMKTNYVKISDDYQWRAPFSGANYIPGIENNVMDDLGLMTWGTRDAYLPATVETGTHIAYFDVSKRYDARGANYYIQNSGDLSSGAAFGEYSYKLDKIRLYSKAEIAAQAGNVQAATPLKTVHFEYDYSLCKNVENNNPDDTDLELLAANSSITEKTGKLTLKRVWFTYEKSNRGELSPYQFAYSSTNPDYDDSKIDRWGVYRSDFLNPTYQVCDNINLPYVNQSPSDKTNQDIDVAAWHLDKITLPSGSTLKIELERDDYAYVQDAVATRLFQLESVADNYTTTNDSNDDDLLEHQEGTFENRQVKFRLEHPINPSDIDAQEQLEAYINDLPIEDRYGQPHKQLYYKIRVNLRNTNNPLWEYVPGYADIEKDQYGREIHFDSPDPVSGLYTHAYITLRGSRIQLASTSQRFHPMAMTSWKYLRDNLPTKFLETDLGGPPNAMTSLDQLTENIDAVFKGFYNYAYQKGFAKVLDLNRSFIRLNTPDKIQYGGGARVKKLTLQDNWASTSTETSTLGITYDYTTTDENGKTISSGVVENEPFVGYDECALRWADINEESRGGIVRDVYKYEYPLNEGYHPGGNVGYSKVSVRSIASDYAYQESLGKDINALDLKNKDFGTTGQKVFEYYTAKDFPIVTGKTALDDTETNPWAVMLLEIISLNRMERYTGMQGYSIELNNMHGQMKRVSSYAQLPNGAMDINPLKKIEYTYKSKEIVDTRRGHRNQKIKVLDNEVKVLVNDDPEQIATVTHQTLGVDYDFFMDGREVVKAGSTVGTQFNTAYTPLWIFGFFPWPEVNFHESKVRTSVANKIINRTGILERVDAYDGQSHISTKNLVFNAQTGAPVLTTVDNQLGGDIYNYGVPAYFANSKMGAAYKNIRVETSASFNQNRDGCTGYYQVNSTSSSVDWIEGDEFIAIVSFDASKKYKMIYMGELFNSLGNKTHQFDIIDAPNPPSNFSVNMLTVRSGNRNLVNTTIAQYSTVDISGNPLTSQSNPLTDRTIGGTTWTADMYGISKQGANAILSTPIAGNSLSPAILNNVLSASAVDFSDNWILEDYDYCSNKSLNGVNPYISGEKGVWRTQSSYTYIDDREQYGLAQQNEEVDIRKSGVLNNFQLFNWRSPFMEYTDESNWVRSQDITKYHLGGQSVESRDVLGNYQAAIYGYNDNLVTAQGSNTTHYELAYEGFEEFNKGGPLLNFSSQGAINTGHIDIYPMSCNTTEIIQDENYRLTYPMQKPTGNKGLILVRKPFEATLPSNTKAVLHLNNGQEQHTVEANIIGKYRLLSNGQRYKVAGLTNLIDATTDKDYTVYELDLSTCPNSDLNNSDWWAGRVTLKYTMPVIPSHPSIGNDEITDAYAHTGRYSLRIDKAETSQYVHKHTYYQNTLRLQLGKEYVISAWVKVDNINPSNIEPLPTYASNGQRNIQFCGKKFEPKGPIIDGWQRIEGKAKYTGNDDIIIQDNTSFKDYMMYVDDLRIFPVKGNMVSYVYDPINYKLRATLDDNNYATFYIYDQSGALTSTKQETERGIITVQESRSYVSEPDQ